MSAKKRLGYLAQKYFGKKILLFCCEEHSFECLRFCDFSRFNIIGVTGWFSEKLRSNVNGKFVCIDISSIENIEFDAIFVLDTDFYKILSKLECNYSDLIRDKNIKIEPFFRKYYFVNPLIENLLKFVYCFCNPNELCVWVLRFLAFCGTFYILDANKKKCSFWGLYSKLATNLYGHQILRTALSIGDNFVCSAFSNVNGYTIIKNNVSLNGLKITGRGMVTIGNNFHCGQDCSIITQSHNYDCGSRIPYDSTSVCKNVEIGDFVWIGSQVTLLPGTRLGEGVIIQAGSVVHGEIPAYAIAGGNPAKVFKYRDIEHFKKLKSDKMFY